MKHRTVIGMMSFMLLLAACAPSVTKIPQTLSTATSTSIQLTRTGNVKLLFVYSPGCPLSADQTPIIAEFAKKNPDIEVSQVSHSNLNDEQEGLISGISGYPIMVFYDENHVRRIAGETSMSALEDEYRAFKDQLSGPSMTTVMGGSLSI